MCLIWFKLDLFLFSIRHMVMWLYRNLMLLHMVYTCTWIKYSVHKTGTIIFLTPMSLLSVELHPLILYFYETLVMAPASWGIMPTVCPRRSLYMAYDAYTHHFIIESMSALRFILTPNNPLMYFITHFRYPQSSLSGAFIIVVRKSNTFWKFRRNRPIANKSCATTWWNCAAFFQSGVLRLLI